uniref:Uncharacterized protein n=1 Tax=Avena sativa TaxID=4498 RepID=A0ACD5UTP7_AVESA
MEEVENDLQALGVRESSILDKLKSAEDQLEHSGRALEHTTSKKIDLEALYQSLLEDTEAKLQQAGDNLTQKETECQQLSEKLKLAEEQVASYEAKTTAASEEVESMKVELEAFENEIATHETTIEELKTKVSSAELKAEDALAESVAVSGANQILKEELDAKLAMLHELQEQFNSTHAEKEDVVTKLAEHGRTIEHLTEVHSRGLELQSAAESRNAEVEAQMREAHETIEQKDSEMKDLNDRLIALQSETESLMHVNEALQQEINAKLVMVDELQEKFASVSSDKEEAANKLAVHEETIKHLTEDHSRGLELHSAAESRYAEIESQLREALETIAGKEAEVTEFKEKLVSLEARYENLADKNEYLKEEVFAKVAMYEELQERFNATHAEKEEAVEKLAVHEGTITHLTEVHTRNLELHSAAESKNGETEAKLHEALEAIAQREAEVKDLSKKLDALEIELGYYEEQATEAAANEENHKVNFDEAVHKLKNLESQLAETQNKVELFHTEKENLISANSSLNEELEVHQSKLNELQLALAAAVAEKQGSSEEIHSLHKTLDGMIQRKEELESQVSSTLEEHEELKVKYQSTLEEKQILNDKYETAKKELDEAITKLEEQMNLDKSEKELHISKLERQITVSELKYMEEIQTMQVETTEKNEALTTKMQEHANVVQAKDELEQQLLEVRKELDAAYHTIANQEEQASVREIKWDAYKTYSADQLEAQKQHTVDLEKQIATLTQQLQLAETQYEQKVEEEREKLTLVNTELNKLTQNLSKSAEMETKVPDLEQKLQAKDAVVSSKSREFSLDSATPQNKQHDRSQAPGAAPTAQVREPSGIMAFKFILGVALLSVVIGVFLGKKY